MEFVIGEKRVLVTNGVADRTVAFLLGSEDHEAAFDRVIHSLLIMAILPSVKRRVAADHRTLKGRNALLNHFISDRLWSPGFGELLAVARISIKSLHNSGQGIRHFHRILHRPFGLILQTRGASIPELHVEIRGVGYWRGMPRSCLLSHALRKLLGIGEAVLRAVACRAGNSVVYGKNRVIVESTAESDGFSRWWIVGWNRDRWKAQRSFNLNWLANRQER